MGRICVDKKVKYKNKITSKLLQEPEDGKKLTKFVSEKETQEGGEEGTAGEGDEQYFCCSVFKSILLGQLTIKIN